jgi:hypothetical protein
MRDQDAALRVERRPDVGRRLVQPPVRGGDAAADGEVADNRPHDEEDEDDEQRDPDAPAPARRPAGPRSTARLTVGAPVAPALGPELERNSPLDAAAPVDAIGLVGPGH